MPTIRPTHAALGLAAGACLGVLGYMAVRAWNVPKLDEIAPPAPRLICGSRDSIERELSRQRAHVTLQVKQPNGPAVVQMAVIQPTAYRPGWRLYVEHRPERSCISHITTLAQKAARR